MKSTIHTSHRDYSFLGTTQSLCPECLAVVPAKIVVRKEKDPHPSPLPQGEGASKGRVYFRKTCPQHGTREDFVCSDVAWYDRMEFALPARMPAQFGVLPDKGCPLDCGLCTEHEQHTCIGVLEITSSCNLTCPMCYAGSSPGGKHLSLADCQRQIDRLVAVEGRAEVCQLSGGEPTIHPQFREIVEYALSREIDYVMVNTNGIRFARDPSLVELAARHKDRLEIYFQFDGLHDEVYRALRGEPLLETKLAALEALGQAGVHVTLVCTLQGGVNDEQMGPLVEFGLSKPWITGISFQPATYSGRHVLPADLERRITFPDVIRGVAAQTKGLFREEDFLPLPCAHPNCHQIAIAYRTGGTAIPVTRMIDAEQNFDLLANGISFTRSKAKNLILQYLSRQACCGGNCGPDTEARSASEGAGLVQGSRFKVQSSIPTLNLELGTLNSVALPSNDFFRQVIDEKLGAENLFRITITSFLDAYNFDVRRVMKCCTHHVLPSGHVIPFCAYNVLYRDGHVPLPELAAAISAVCASHE
ncbi:MAG: radical SAM protein [Pirellulaceae bacterium]|nr:radical SAM protein [Pirellulaceae bacterium]